MNLFYLQIESNSKYSNNLTMLCYLLDEVFKWGIKGIKVCPQTMATVPEGLRPTLLVLRCVKMSRGCR